MQDTVMVFTSKSFETMVEEGGSGNWAANETRLRHTKWLVATRNANSTWTQGNEPHGSAFLIGRVTGVKAAAPPEQDRYVITFDRYANIAKADAWSNNRNPVAYVNLEDLGIDVASLDWKTFPSAQQPNSEASGGAGAVVEQARAMIAAALSISPEAVKITVAL